MIRDTGRSGPDARNRGSDEVSYGLALITGASSSIGAAFARALPAATGLLLTGRDGAALDALAREVARDGRAVETVVADLAEDAGRGRLLDAVADQPLDLLVNNAGLGRFGAMTDNAPEIERAMVEVNVVAPTLLTRALLPGMLARARQDGRRAGVIVVASIAAFAPLPFLSTYAATKAFDLYLAEGLAGEMKGEPVDVLALCPGPTRTEFFARAGGEGMARSGAAEPAQVAREGLRALGRTSVHVVGGGNRAYTALTRLIPRPVLRGATRGYMKRAARASRRA